MFEKGEQRKNARTESPRGSVTLYEIKNTEERAGSEGKPSPRKTTELTKVLFTEHVEYGVLLLEQR